LDYGTPWFRARAGAETTVAERSLVYPVGHDVRTDLLRLLACTTVIAALLLLAASRKREHACDRPMVAGAFT
jgi:hypothetical protein